MARVIVEIEQLAEGDDAAVGGRRETSKQDSPQRRAIRVKRRPGAGPFEHDDAVIGEVNRDALDLGRQRPAEVAGFVWTGFRA